MMYMIVGSWSRFLFYLNCIFLIPLVVILYKSTDEMKDEINKCYFHTHKTWARLCEFFSFFFQ